MSVALLLESAGIVWMLVSGIGRAGHVRLIGMQGVFIDGSTWSNSRERRLVNLIEAVPAGEACNTAPWIS
jgi:hypothetical protein